MINKHITLTTEQAYRAACYLILSFSEGSKKYHLPPMGNLPLFEILGLIPCTCTGSPDGAYTADLWKDAVEKALSEPAQVENV